MMYKILNNMAPVYLRDHFKMSFTDQEYSLRNRKLCLILPRAQTAFLKKSFAFSGAKVWNELPEEVKCSNSLQIFKKRNLISCLKLYIAIFNIMSALL